MKKFLSLLMFLASSYSLVTLLSMEPETNISEYQGHIYYFKTDDSDIHIPFDEKAIILLPYLEHKISEANSNIITIEFINSVQLSTIQAIMHQLIFAPLGRETECLNTYFDYNPLKIASNELMALLHTLECSSNTISTITSALGELDFNQRHNEGCAPDIFENEQTQRGTKRNYITVGTSNGTLSVDKKRARKSPLLEEMFNGSEHINDDPCHLPFHTEYIEMALSLQEISTTPNFSQNGLLNDYTCLELLTLMQTVDYLQLENNILHYIGYQFVKKLNFDTINARESQLLTETINNSILKECLDAELERKLSIWTKVPILCRHSGINDIDIFLWQGIITRDSCKLYTSLYKPYNNDTSKIINNLPSHCITPSESGKTFVAQHGSKLIVHNPITRMAFELKFPFELKSCGKIESFRYSKDSKSISCFTYDSNWQAYLTVWDSKNGQCLKNLTLGAFCPSYSQITWSPNNKNICIYYSLKKLHCVNTETNTFAQQNIKPYKPKEGSTNSKIILAISDDLDCVYQTTAKTLLMRSCTSQKKESIKLKEDSHVHYIACAPTELALLLEKPNHAIIISFYNLQSKQFTDFDVTDTLSSKGCTKTSALVLKYLSDSRIIIVKDRSEVDPIIIDRKTGVIPGNGEQVRFFDHFYIIKKNVNKYNSYANACIVTFGGAHLDKTARQQLTCEQQLFLFKITCNENNVLTEKETSIYRSLPKPFKRITRPHIVKYDQRS